MKRRDEVLVGLLATVSIIAAVLASFWLARGGLQSGYKLFAKFTWGAGLKQVAARLQSVAGQGDLIVRMGGDEFILVQKSVAGQDDAERMAQRIFESISAPYGIDDHDIVIGASIGIAMSPDDGCSVEALLSRSDKALYHAKTQRGGFVFAQDLIPAMNAGTSQVPARQRAA